jgi:hypothetical protein
MIEGISFQVCKLSGRYFFKLLNVLCLQHVGAYIFKEVIDLHECISSLLWQ